MWTGRMADCAAPSRPQVSAAVASGGRAPAQCSLLSANGRPTMGAGGSAGVWRAGPSWPERSPCGARGRPTGAATAQSAEDPRGTDHPPAEPPSRSSPRLSGPPEGSAPCRHTSAVPPGRPPPLPPPHSWTHPLDPRHAGNAAHLSAAHQAHPWPLCRPLCGWSWRRPCRCVWRWRAWRPLTRGLVCGGRWAAARSPHRCPRYPLPRPV
mmetsp:Transcript_27219/g.78297  ORF Transcript_27219/g.78297 Transcript_27219/m.78297 type:complete len:209 (-) Transcript_27219:695-1321(-)